MKKTLESFLYRVKAMLATNGQAGAFWLGNLKNRNLQVPFRRRPRFSSSTFFSATVFSVLSFLRNIWYGLSCCYIDLLTAVKKSYKLSFLFIIRTYINMGNIK